MHIVRIQLTNFLSYRDAVLELGDLTALVGPNAAGKSNAVAAIRLLHEIPALGLSTALARRGGFDQLRHRSHGRPYDPGLRIEFEMSPGDPLSHYNLQLGALKGKRYIVKLERGELRQGDWGVEFTRDRRGLQVSTPERWSFGGDSQSRPAPRVPEAQSALPVVVTFGALKLWDLLESLQPVEIDPHRVKELQDPSPVDRFEPDGSNAASFFEALTQERRNELVDQLGAIVPGIVRIEPRHVADKVTVFFYQTVAGKEREFSAKQMSDGTLRAFGILLALLQPRSPSLAVIEEPETAIHLGALRTLVEVLRAYSQETQILLTTHSADIVDGLELDELRVVWNEDGASRIARVAEHTRGPVRDGLITPGELLRSDALDPALV